MNTKVIAYLLAFSLLLGVSDVAYGASEDTRYLVKSSSGFWKKSFGVRHEFKEGFTTDLTDWQLRVAKVFGVEVVPVHKLYILPESPVVQTGQANSNDTTGKRPLPSPTRPIPSDSLPWGIRAMYNSDPTLVKTSGGADVNVAVLDTGVLANHPDLTNRIAQCKDFTSPKTPVINDKCEDKNGHGTHVAGTIAADGGSDGKGIYGVVPEANLFAYKVCGTNGSCWSDDIAFALKTAADNNVNVVNLSLGSDTESTLIKDAITYAVSKNVLVVAAAGNDGPYVGSIDYPGANPNVIAVGAFDSIFDIAEWSSRGLNSESKSYVVEEKDIEFAAPGVNIESTWKDGGYVILSGTSMATPHVAGLAAKLWQVDADDPDSATRELLHLPQFSTDLLPPGDDDASGFGFPHL
ncbi:MAG: hypothetical protein A3B91_02685 [Candidatus Yanofskybacteria bacterium RIFCSPHIGHO2_02_FULL_41_29]|uniref:Peptidase S8/S53 domain-containing protein n=1 Tax=Candidatus Yanofskybacteria bacterium RIFCSPHIGHO2_01_FULL_41_53 TaxID=1802663 RepID=A0A1F8EM81_9BACT|nr:MAG: hypothetical protein A2650_00445 [Candidatus Yanofskybacteria bacterium RIFCSPHIGHO2_01_FULL_41_53]OGN10772.1 MAG: hypothetical protein A3B91_02685 [Candidatus Yanofskybacteria bacterium RIFCSPHIGHO2_02_FULL_41_29]OGN21793.1 MAG: hypothetical protein A2916_01250 [Candidatus Yanofskybacteria bacterium RIFCSPLOWO2_01_FULL_41_67]OGN29407.1 MAG: hypothetical protein A3H54_04085 [Candidatus Yanofskybacteria bacterium RIFCSPLOWO2_02_FULL_41_13]OGN36636.1 MAG: hypothetical protein A3F98_02815 